MSADEAHVSSDRLHRATMISRRFEADRVSAGYRCISRPRGWPPARRRRGAAAGICGLILDTANTTSTAQIEDIAYSRTLFGTLGRQFAVGVSTRERTGCLRAWGPCPETLQHRAG